MIAGWGVDICHLQMERGREQLDIITLLFFNFRTFLPSAYTAYPVTGPDDGGRVTACHVTKSVPSCGPAST